jgi:hypothetical protein
MTQITLVLPFALPPAELAADLVRALKAPALAGLLSRAAAEELPFDPGQRMLPHETWLSRKLGLSEDGHPAFAAAAMRGLGLDPGTDSWFIVNPAHVEIARSHLTITDLRQLRLSNVHAHELFETAKPVCDEAGKTLVYGDAHTWFMRAGDWRTLQTSSPDAAVGLNLTDWLPTGTGAAEFRKLQNEVQMLWFEHPSNVERESRGLAAINSFWPWGRSCPDVAVPATPLFAASVVPSWLSHDPHRHPPLPVPPVRNAAPGRHPPVLARLYAARGLTDAELSSELSALMPPSGLLHIDAAAVFLADAIAAGKKMVIVADYDCDGATACAVALRGLRAMGAQVDFIVPNRFEYGYGLTPEIVELTAREKAPDIIITVDNGIASIDGVAEANRRGIEVVVTDHHLPGDTLPAARVIVNPNQPECGFPSKHLAGVGVVFYVLLALRAELRRRGVFDAQTQPKLDNLLDLVALGTVADVVGSTPTTASWSRRASSACAPGACTPAWRRCSAWPAAKRAAPRPSTWASRSARA